MRYNNDRRYFKGNPRESGRVSQYPARQPAHGGMPPAPNHSYRPEERPDRNMEPEETPDPTTTGAEAAYLRTLVDSKQAVTVVLNTGERLRGCVRYYDHSMISLGQTEGGANIFLPKHSIDLIIED
jgi:sRNA-binding regulator protein Hfq